MVSFAKVFELGGGEQGGLSPPPTWYPQGGEGYQVLAAPKCFNQCTQFQTDVVHCPTTNLATITQTDWPFLSSWQVTN